MLVKVIQENAEQIFLLSLQKNAGTPISKGVLRCAFSIINFQASADSILKLFRDTLRDNDAVFYFCQDGDVLIEWKGSLKGVRNMIINNLSHFYKDKLEDTPQEEIFRFYDMVAQAEDLHVFILDKITHLPAAADAEEAPGLSVPRSKREIIAAMPKPSFSDDQLQIFSRALRNRKRRRNIEILVVEDQDFSLKLLIGLLEKNWTCYGARNAEEALELYSARAPDICFLDIALPDGNGHELAELFSAHDLEKFIIMVTEHRSVKDVVTAKQNHVDGFIVKPYNKQKILHAVELHMIRKSNMMKKTTSGNV